MIELTEEQTDDIIFYARIGELEELQTCIKELSQAKSISEIDIIAAYVEQDSQNTPLHMAAANGQLDTLNYLLNLIISPPSKSTALLNAQNEWGNTPLHWAALNGHLEAVKALVAAGANTGIKNKAGHDAVYEAQMNSKDEVVEWLLLQDKELEFDNRGEESREPVGAVDGDDDDEVKEEKVQNDETELLVVKTEEITLETTLQAKNT